MKKIRFNLKHLHNIQCMEDFYYALHLKKAMQNGQIKNINQLHMCKVTNEALLDLCKKNSIRCPKIKHLAPKYRDHAVAMDWLCYSPTTNDEVPSNELWILSPEEATEYEAKRRTKENGGG